jgi:hypothetical protein
MPNGVVGGEIGRTVDGRVTKMVDRCTTGRRDDWTARLRSDAAMRFAGMMTTLLMGCTFQVWIGNGQG